MRAHLVSLMASALVAAAVLLTLPAAAQAATWPVPTRDVAGDATRSALSLEDFETTLMMTINEARVANGLRPVALFDECTDRMAERWGMHIARTGILAHRDQNEVIRRCETSWAGEALVRGVRLTPRAMVDLWMGSPGHREILLSPRAKRAGVAVVPDAEGRLIGVLNLTRP